MDRKDRQTGLSAKHESSLKSPKTGTSFSFASAMETQHTQ